MMAAGALDRRITIQQSIETRDASGQVTETWIPYLTLWATAQPLSGRERYAAQQVAADVDTRFRVRFPESPVSPKSHRISYAGRIYDIRYVSEVGRREGLEILGQARAE